MLRDLVSTMRNFKKSTVHSNTKPEGKSVYFYMNHRRSKHSQIVWTEINRVGPTPVDLESTDSFTLSFNYYYYYSRNLSPSLQQPCPQSEDIL